MKTQKLLVIVASVCLMAFLNVSTFAQTALAQPDPAKVMPRFIAQTLRAAGLEVIRDGDVLIVEGKIALRVPSTLQDWEESGIRSRLVEPAEDDPPPTEDELFRFSQFRNCLNVADLLSQLEYTVCELNTTDIGDFTCKVEALLDHIFDSLRCFFAYYCGPENNFCE